MAAAERGFESIVIALLGCEETYVNLPNRVCLHHFTFDITSNSFKLVILYTTLFVQLGHTALMFASSAGHTDVVRTLVALEYTRVYIWNNVSREQFAFVRS